MRTLSVLFVGLCAACRSGEPSLPLLIEAQAAAEIGVEGGALVSGRGDRLIIPPGALSETTEITLTPVDFGTSNVRGGAVDLEPDGLVFAQPATLEIRLREPLPPGTELTALSSQWFLDSGDLTPTGSVFTVDSSGTVATGLIHHFSAKAVLQNCHAGTRDMLFEAWQGAPGRDLAALSAATNVPVAELGAHPGEDQYSPATLQKILKGLFRPCGELAPGTPSNAALAAELTASVQRGEAVVALFGGALPVGDDGFRQNVAHSAFLTMADGRLVVRGRLNVTQAMLTELETCGKDVRVDQPFDEIDRPGHGLRDLRNSEIYPYLVHGRNLPNRDSVQRAYPHVVFFCENAPTSCPSMVSGKSDQGCEPDEPVTEPEAPTCPVTEDSSDGCAAGFSFSRETIACEQTECPANAGRTYTLECCCDCWDDKTYQNVYDPCRPGFLLRCDPR